MTGSREVPKGAGMFGGATVLVVAALALAAGAAPASADRTSVSGAADQVPLTAYLSPAATDAVLGSWGLSGWKRVRR